MTVFENELHDMTAAAKPELTSEDLAWGYRGHVVFEEVPYFGHRTDLVGVRVNTFDLARRYKVLDHFEPLPDERKYRRSYRKLQRREPISRHRWIHEDSTYIEQTAREVWGWLADNSYLAPVEAPEVGYQQRLDGSLSMDPHDDHQPVVTRKFPDAIRVTAWELKPRDWERALEQARRARCYAERQMVLMDAGGVDVDEIPRKPFSEADVGLATLDEDGIEIHYQTSGQASPPDTKTRQLLNERALARAPDDLLDEAREKAGEVQL